MTARRTRVLSTVAAVLVIIVGAIVLAAARDEEPDRVPTELGGPAMVVRPDSHRLTDPPGARVTFVEFLDFECESCRAAYPAVEQLRADYGDRVSFVVRYFPVPGHFNGERAARAVEAAAGQGRFEQMYQRMYETQPEWGEKRVPQDAVFRGFAADLGLDLPAFDAAYDNPATAARVLADFDEGLALGVTGTPTFFVNDTMIPATHYEDLTTALDAALAEN